jgi:hypothetical protein
LTSSARTPYRSFPLSGKSHSFHRASSRRQTRFAGLCRRFKSGRMIS